MDQQLVACPVCTLFLREGMSMQSHLNTHPKDQVIDALVRLYTTRPYAPAYTPQTIVNPFQVVSEEHIFLGRQQVITNAATIHAPFMGYPVYPNQQILGASSEYSQSEIQLNVSTQDTGVITTVVNYSNDEIYNRGGEEAGPEASQVKVQMPEPEEYEQLKPPEAESEQFDEQKTNEDGETIIQQAMSQGAPSPYSHHSEASHMTMNEDDVDHHDGILHPDEPEPEYITDEVIDEDSKAPPPPEEGLNDAELSNSALNIQANEKMPARGELSGHGSIGNTVNSVWLQEVPTVSEAIWAQRNGEPKKKFPCLYCAEEFLCPKERRVHVATLHCNPDMKTFNKEIMCLKCGLQVSTQKDLKAHMKAEHKRVPRQCSTCGEEFKTQELFTEHLLKVHPLECRTCGKTFHSRPSLYIHTKIHMTMKPYACTLCSKSFITNQKLKEHVNGHTGNTPYQCNMCDRKFKRYSNLKQHKNQAHLEVKKKSKEFFCDCGETFPTKKKLDWHKETHSAKPKQCMYCSERYVHAASLTRHIRRAHDSHFLPKDESEKKRNVTCPVCNMVFMESSLRIHMKQHSAPKQFGCIVCGKRFLTKWNLQLHRWTHASRMSKPYKCSMCKAAFVRQGDLTSHIRTHYNTKPFTCNHCGQQFNRKHNWQRHEKEHVQDKNYSCAVCGKTFHRSYYLVEHMRIHTGIKPFSCHICNKTSSTKSNHNKHVKTHHAREAVNSEF